MSNMFRELIQRSRRISREEFARNFGEIANDVIEMIDSDQAQRVTQQAREIMETSGVLPNGQPRLRRVEFGLFSGAPELERGEVAAVDGTPVLPMQIFSAGQALCVGVGSISHRRPMQDSLHYWSSKVFLSDAESADDFIAREEQGIFGISQTAYLRYFEVSHGLELAEPCIFFDGTLVDEWLTATTEGVDLYLKLFESGKQCIGVIKNLKANAVFATYARALKTGEIYVIETLADHLEKSNVLNKRKMDGARRYVRPQFHHHTAPHILRGIFKPQKKAFGFEVHENHLETMLRILAADCQLNNIGHEIPYLLNRVDEEVRKGFNQRILQNRITAQMAKQSEELFFQEAHERSLR